MVLPTFAETKVGRTEGYQLQFEKSIVKLLYYPYRIIKKILIIQRLICIGFIMILLYLRLHCAEPMTFK